MGGFFSYESKPMQILMFLGDLILLNVLYLVCCIPVVTIGAAQAGMYTACKVLLDKEDDSSPYAAFFRGFWGGFGTVTLAWGILTAVTAAVAWVAISAIMLGSPIWLALLVVIAAVVFSALVSLWAGIISLWACFASAVTCAFVCLIAGVVFLFGQHRLTGIALIGGCLVCAGLGIFLFWGCKILTKGMILLTKKTGWCIRKCFTHKEVA